MTGTQPMANLGTEGQILFDANKKSKLVAYLMWFFLGAFGAHRFYTRRTLSAVIQLALWIGAMVLYFLAMRPFLDYVAQNPQAAENVEDPAVKEALGQMMAEIFQSPMFLAGVALAAIFFIWWLVDAFLIPGWIRRHNTELAQSLAGR
jgi:TM2 domain-containing membrane protein YozV